MNLLDDYSLSQLDKVRWIMSKYGENDPSWRRTIVEMFQTFATQSQAATNSIIAMKFVEISEKHVKMSTIEKNDGEIGTKISADVRIWFDAIRNIEQLTPGAYHRILYNDLWKAIKALHELNGEHLSRVFVDHLQENEIHLEPRFAPESKVQRAEAYMTLGEHTNVWQLLNDVGDWLAVPNHSFSRPSTMLRLLLIYSEAFNLELKNARKSWKPFSRQLNLEHTDFTSRRSKKLRKRWLKLWSKISNHF